MAQNFLIFQLTALFRRLTAAIRGPGVTQEESPPRQIPGNVYDVRKPSAASLFVE